MKKHFFLIGIINILFCPSAEGQNEAEFSDSLVVREYSYLLNNYYSNKVSNIGLSRMYLKAFIQKSKLESNNHKLAEGYELSSYLYNGEIGIQYADSIIDLASVHDDRRMQTVGYITKAMRFYSQRDFIKALDFNLKAYAIAKRMNNDTLTHSINHTIGLLKSRSGEYQESLGLFKENYEYYSKLIPSSNKELLPFYFTSIFALADAYRRVQKYDSATYFNRLGVKKAIQYNDSKYKNYFIHNEGINLYFKKKYKSCIDSLHQVIPKLISYNDNGNLAYANSFIGKSYFKLGEIEKSVPYLKKVDTVFMLTNDIHPELRDSYEFLIKYFAEKEDNQQQLLYIKRLLSLDSVLINNYKYVQNVIHKEYETSLLIDEKQEIINKLKGSSKKNEIWILFLIFIVVFVAILGIRNYNKRIIYRKRFDSLMSDFEHLEESINKKPKKEKKSIGISEQVVQSILDQLKEFENSNKFLRKDITIHTLSKEIHTNARYLSNVINTYKEKTFVNYINDLRISFLLKKLNADQEWRNYKIKAIGEEIGFKNVESFNKAFSKKTGIYPSYFIDQLNKQTPVN